MTTETPQVNERLTKRVLLLLCYGGDAAKLLGEVTRFLLSHNSSSNPTQVLNAILTTAKLEAPALAPVIDNVVKVINKHK